MRVFKFLIFFSSKSEIQNSLPKSQGDIVKFCTYFLNLCRKGRQIKTKSMKRWHVLDKNKNQVIFSGKNYPNAMIPKLSILNGSLLILLGLAGFFLAGHQKTALIPALFGLVFVLLGAVSLVRETWRKHLMHVAAALALLSVGATAKGLSKLPALLSGAEVGRPPAAIWAQSVMCVLCLVFLAFCVKSFIDARRKRMAS